MLSSSPKQGMAEWTERAGACSGLELTMRSDENRWFALHVRSRCEKLVTAGLRFRNIEVVAALISQRRIWADRVRIVEMPLFPGYVFARFSAQQRIDVEKTSGVACIVKLGSQCSPIDDEEMQSLLLLLRSNMKIQRAQHLEVGSQIRVKCGPLTGVCGSVVSFKNRFRLQVRISLLQRAVEVEIDEAMVEAIHSQQSFVTRTAAGMT